MKFDIFFHIYIYTFQDPSTFVQNRSFIGTSLIYSVIHQFDIEFNGEFKKRKNNANFFFKDFIFIYSRCVEEKIFATLGQL